MEPAEHREKFVRRDRQDDDANNDDDDGKQKQKQQHEESTQRFKVTVSYDGTDFAGFQLQHGQDTIQGRIEQRLSSVFCGKTTGMAIAGSGRTDAGVHAQGQVFHFDAPLVIRQPDKSTKTAKAAAAAAAAASKAAATTAATSNTVTMREKTIDAALVLQFLRNGLPPSIQVLAVEAVPNSFHARESCVKKRYEYRVCEGVASPFRTRFCYSLGYGKQLDVDKMRVAAQFLIGTHDFSAFGVIEEGDPRSPIKTMTRLEIVRQQTAGSDTSEVSIVAECDRFLWHMMRMVSGTLIEVGLGNIQPDDVKSLLEAKERGAKHQTAAVRVRTAPAQGLCLMKVFY